MFTRSLNLQDMCLTAIVRDIDLFVYNKTIPQKHINFLFQAYSDEVFSKHKILKRFINEDCMVWFLNPHVKKVTVPANFHSERVMQQLKVIGSGIISLNLHNSKFSENELNSIVCCLPRVFHLNLSDTSCSDETLACIVKSCPDLKSLDISVCDSITERGIEILCNSKLSLKTLNILYSDMEPLNTAIILNRMPSLECIKCEDLTGLLYEIGKNKEYNLTELLFSDNFLDNDVKLIKACARMCPKLKKLHFEYPVQERVLKGCVNFQNLEELKIKMFHRFSASIRVNDDLTPILPISKNLKTLILSCMEISVLTLIDCFRNLENLYLKEVSFAPYKKEDVKITKTNLLTLVGKHIDMKINDPTYEAIALLISLSKNVTELHLNYIENLPVEIFDVILNSMKNLTLVNFNHTFVKRHYLNHLFEIPSLATITANYCEDPQEISASNLLAKNASSTLSWRVMYDSEEDNEDDYDSNSYKYYYDDDDDTDEQNILSDDKCCSSDSDRDYAYWYNGFEDYDDEYDDMVVNMMYNNDPYDDD